MFWASQPYKMLRIGLNSYASHVPSKLLSRVLEYAVVMSCTVIFIFLSLSMENYGETYNQITVRLTNHHISCTVDSRLLGTRRHKDLINLSAFS